MLCGSDRSGAADLFAVLRLACMALVAVAGCLATAGCNTSGMPSFDIPSLNVSALGAGGNAIAGPRTVAFDSIDGPPEPLFRKLVAHLGQEASARKIAMVSREQPAQYVIRGYLAAHVQGRKTTITWVWDVFTAGHDRVARFTGEVPGAMSERAWAAADDAVVARMAQDGMSRLAAFLGDSGPAPGVASASGPEGTMAFLPTSRP